MTVEEIVQSVQRCSHAFWDLAFLDVLATCCLVTVRNSHALQSGVGCEESTGPLPPTRTENDTKDEA